jgi:hypothetical protein
VVGSSGDILADRTDRRIENVVLNMLVNLEFGSEGAHQVATLRVIERSSLDRLEQPPNQLMVLDQDLVGLLALAGVTGAHRLHVDRLTRQSLARNDLVAWLLLSPDLDVTLAQADLVAGLRAS